MRVYAESKHPSVDKATYKLYGVSHHSGSLSGGHYVCEVSNVNTGQWYSCNDGSVSKISKPESSSSSAYVLFYTMEKPFKPAKPMARPI